MIEALLSMPQPEDREVYHKMTDFFTLRIGGTVSSEHYGTEFFLFQVTDAGEAVLREIMEPYQGNFSIRII